MGRGAIGATRGPSRVGDGEQSATDRPNRMEPALRHQVAAVEQLLDLALEQRLDLHPLLERQVARLFLEQVAVQVDVLQVHRGVVDVFLVDVDVEHLEAGLDVLGQEVLDRIDLVVDVVILALDVAGEAEHAVVGDDDVRLEALDQRSEEHTSELQSLMRISYAVFCLKNKNNDEYKTRHK